MNKAINIIDWIIWSLVLATDVGAVITGAVGDSLANYTITYAGIITGITGATMTVLATLLTVARLVKTKLTTK